MIFLFGLSFLNVGAHPETNKFKIRNVIIFGESNLIKFQLKYNDEASVNIKHSHQHITSEIDKTLNVFEFSVDEFVGSNRQIESGFKRMLKSEINPNIFIQFNKEFCDQLIEEDEAQILDIMLRIGGIERLVSVECIPINKSESTHLFKGTATVLLSDFNLVPPSRFFGIIKVKDTIMITFEVLLLSK